MAFACRAKCPAARSKMALIALGIGDPDRDTERSPGAGRFEQGAREEGAVIAVHAVEQGSGGHGFGRTREPENLAHLR